MSCLHPPPPPPRPANRVRILSEHPQSERNDRKKVLANVPKNKYFISEWSRYPMASGQ